MWFEIFCTVGKFFAFVLTAGVFSAATVGLVACGVFLLHWISEH